MSIANTLAVLMGSALVIVGITVFNKSYFNAVMMQIPFHRGQSFRRIADSVPVIADSFR